MADIDIRIQNRAGRITLNRPAALNALTYDMANAIEAALDTWRSNPAIDLVIIDAAGDRAFCAGGDIADLYASGIAGDFAYGQKFWADEYRLNAKIAEYPKPIVTFMQGFTMGGGVGIGCHASHRIVGETSQISMPECGIGLVPDVGGSLLLARAPGRLGDYLGLTAARMGPGDAIYAGFADLFVPISDWPALIETLCDGDLAALNTAHQPAPEAPLAALLPEIDALFQTTDLAELITALSNDNNTFAQSALKSISRNSPLSLACTLQMLGQLRRPGTTIRDALALEYRFTARAMEHGDFIEGIRAAIIDKTRDPQWTDTLNTVTMDRVRAMLAPLPDLSLDLGEQT